MSDSPDIDDFLRAAEAYGDGTGIEIVCLRADQLTLRTHLDDLRKLATHTTLRVGDVLHGFLHGYFDKAQGPARVEAIGTDWVVIRLDDGPETRHHGDINPNQFCDLRDPDRNEQ